MDMERYASRRDNHGGRGRMKWRYQGVMWDKDISIKVPYRLSSRKWYPIDGVGGILEKEAEEKGREILLKLGEFFRTGVFNIKIYDRFKNQTTIPFLLKISYNLEFSFRIVCIVILHFIIV
jgi:hypothetical protein